ncbi:alpha/beta hydrolase family protein [Cryptosporangium sp. NPDC051539]|uniref:alpha/beta hydrolase family protein n=1 Tax=Cryptosporangium sp. NPDC051539 TaxID=3363962 RepID=UPI00379B921B
MRFRALSLVTAAAVALTLTSAIPASATDSPAPASATGSDRGDLISATRLRTLTPAQAKSELASEGFSSAETRYGVTLYRLTYRTVGPTGRPTTASGLVTLPGSRPGTTLKVVSYAHGSEVFRGDAPSVTDDRWTTAPAVSYASAGFATVAPDYLGLGLGPGPHPYLDVSSETTASVDLLRATGEFAPTVGATLSRDVFVTGFSQGASAAMGLARELQSDRPSGLRLAAVAPVSGAYHLRDSEIPAMLDGRLDSRWSTAYVAYLLISWNRLHDLYASPSEVFRAPYDRTLPPLFDNEHPGEQLLSALPASPSELLTPAGVRLLRQPSAPFAAALRESDRTCAGWAPRVPIRLYATSTDEQAAYSNTLACRSDLADRGVRAPVVEVGPTDHLGSVARSTVPIVRWFRSLS